MDFGSWLEQKCLEFFSWELEFVWLFIYFDVVFEDNVCVVVECYCILKLYIEKYGINCLGFFIVSMICLVFDLLVVYLFVWEVGLIEMMEEGLVCIVLVVFLLEIVDDLEWGLEILCNFLEYFFIVCFMCYFMKICYWEKFCQ